MGAPDKVVNVTMDNLFVREAVVLPALGRTAWHYPDQLMHSFGFDEAAEVDDGGIHGYLYPRRLVSSLPDRFGCTFQKKTRIDDKLILRMVRSQSIINQSR
jgi:hypothetical protein